VDLAIVLAAFIVFDVVAWFWGVDSRPGLNDDRAIDPRPHRSI
jgi:hypothetical protein